MKFNLKTVIYFFTAIVIIGIAIHFITKPHNDSSIDRDRDEELNLIRTLSDQDWETKLPDDVETYKIEKREFIKDINIDRDPICAGQDFKIEVIANNTEGPDTELSYRIASHAGNPAIVRFKNPGTRAIHVWVRNMRENVDHKRITIEVVECPGVPTVSLKASLSNKRADEADYHVISKKGLGNKCEYQWDFGDGTPIVKTKSPFISHNYGKRQQEAFSSTFTTTVTVTDDDYKSAVGRATIAFANIHWMSSKLGYNLIPIIYERFPKQDADFFEVPVTIKNIYNQTIEFSKTDIEFRSCDPSKSPETNTFSSTDFLSTTTIRGGEIAEDTITFTRDNMPESTCGMIMNFKGSLSSGKAVSGRVNLTIPMSSKEAIKLKRGKTVTDPELIRKIREARKILGKKAITPSEIRRLEKEGRI